MAHERTGAKATIRKYSDRRLYDAGASRYVKLDDIARMVRDGIDVEVVDARTGKDITRVILTEIIVEDARDFETGMPLQLLRQLVMASDRATHEFLSWYLSGTLDLYHKARETFQSGVSEARAAVSSPLEFVRHLLGGTAPAASREAGEITELRRRVQELEALLAAHAKPTRKRTGRPRPGSDSKRRSPRPPAGPAAPTRR